MGDGTAITWTDATWNPVTGCSHVSDGCRFCYAEALSLRRGWSKKPWGAQNAAENVVLHPERLDQPLRWRKPRRIFVNSMSDLFHEQVPNEFILKVFRAMLDAPWHTYQILTKRPERMREFMTDLARHAMTLSMESDAGLAAKVPQMPADFLGNFWPQRMAEKMFGHIWLGVSVEDQRRKDRIDYLRRTPAAVRFLSIEPQLEDIGDLDLSGIHWVICGGESGPNHRPFDLDWARSIRDQCQSAGVAFFFKQVGGRTPKAGGDLLDGHQWHEFPEIAS